MKLINYFIFTLAALAALNSFASEPPVDSSTARKNIANASQYRGWDHLVEKLKKKGVPEEDLKRIYQDKRMPRYSKIPFSMKPKESKDIYKGFLKSSKINLAEQFIKQHDKAFQQAESEFNVNRHVISAIILVETQAGRYTGDAVVINRISRLAGIADPNNLVLNYDQLKKKERNLSYPKVASRGRNIEEMFLDEVPALIQIAKTYNYDIFAIRGSRAGAFGLPQFMPTSYLRYAVDGSGDGKVSLYHPEDAIWSVANYLSEHDWNNNLPIYKKKKVIWNYNHSEPYVETVVKLEDILAAK